jgi:hypothetical protein
LGDRQLRAPSGEIAERVAMIVLEAPKLATES